MSQGSMKIKQSNLQTWRCRFQCECLRSGLSRWQDFNRAIWARSSCQAAISARAGCPSFHWWFWAETQTVLQLAVGRLSLLQSGSLCGPWNQRCHVWKFEIFELQIFERGSLDRNVTLLCNFDLYVRKTHVFIRSISPYAEWLKRLVFVLQAYTPHLQVTSRRFE